MIIFNVVNCTCESNEDKQIKKVIFKIKNKGESTNGK